MKFTFVSFSLIFYTRFLLFFFWSSANITHETQSKSVRRSSLFVEYAGQANSDKQKVSNLTYFCLGGLNFF